MVNGVKRCSGPSNVNATGENYKCPSCVGENREQRQEERTMEVDEGDLEIVDQFCYLGEMMTSEWLQERQQKQE